MNYHKKLYKIGFRKMKPTIITRESEEWVEIPMYSEKQEEENRNPRDAREDFHFGLDPIMNTFKYVIDSDRRIYINVSRSGRYQCRIVDDNDNDINFVKYRRSEFSGGELFFPKFEPNFWKNIMSKLDPDLVREIRMKQLFKSSRKGTD